MKECKFLRQLHDSQGNKTATRAVPHGETTNMEGDHGGKVLLPVSKDAARMDRIYSRNDRRREDPGLSQSGDITTESPEDIRSTENTSSRYFQIGKAGHS
jgi:hypothetical protein